MTDAKRSPGPDERCSATRHENWSLVRCSRAGGHEECGKRWCSQHLPSAKAARRKASEAKWDAKWAREAEERDERKRPEAHAEMCVAAHDALVAACEAAESLVTALNDQWTKEDGKGPAISMRQLGLIIVHNKITTALALARAKK